LSLLEKNRKTRNSQATNPKSLPEISPDDTIAKHRALALPKPASILYKIKGEKMSTNSQADFDRAYHRYYTKVYTLDEETITKTEVFYNKIISFLPTDRSIKILDVGCGTGFAVRAIRQKGFLNTFGIEINKEQANAANQLTPDSVQHVEDSTKWLNEHPNEYDFIISTDVIEHIEPSEQLNLVKAIWTSLRPGGSFLCTVPNASSAINGRWRYIDFTHKSSFTETSLHFLLEAAQFTDIKITGSEIFRVLRGNLQTLKEATSTFLRSISRTVRRLEIIAELGFDEGLQVPITVNLLAISKKE
jgi:2-polyprenyl-3-methyl-5-hydroxy-6-metoxy-1,4-benzoquinol methylase